MWKRIPKFIYKANVICIYKLKLYKTEKQNHSYLFSLKTVWKAIFQTINSGYFLKRKGIWWDLHM